MRDLRPLPAALYLPGWQLFPPLVRALSLSTAQEPNPGPGMHVLGANSARPVGADALIGPQNGRRPTGVSRLSLFPFSHEPVGLVHRPLHGVQNILVAGAAAQVAGDELAQLLPGVLLAGAHDLHGGHDDAGGAEAALDGGLLHKGPLDGGQAPVRLLEALHGEDALTLGPHAQVDAGVDVSMKTGADIACISTGNFHEGNARMYTDYMLMTAAKNVTRDVSLVFDFIERPYSPVRFKELLVSPNEMKQKFSRLINEEIKNKQAGKPAYILIKINHITDPVMVKKLYEASSHGVRIDLLVRGNCSLITGVPGVSDTIRINGIIDRYLEHSRIFIFANGGDEKMFIGSADWMPRNLDNRVEVIAPVYDPEIKADLKRVVEYGLKDTLQGRVVDGTGENRPWISEDKTAFRSQEELYKYYLNENRIKD